MLPIYYIKEGSLSFGDKTVLSEIELYISPGDVVCLVGRNGSGKSSLMKIICGEYELDSGQLFQDPAIKIGYLKQDMKHIPDLSIYEYILREFDNDEENKYLADIILDKLQIDGSLNLKNCSGGQIRRAFLAKTLVDSPDILLLDEPTNHLDIRAIEWLESYVKSYQGSIICISHDRRFLENITNKIWWIDRGTLRKSEKGFKYFDEWQEQVINQEEAELRNMNKKLELERNWLSTGVTARRKRNQKRLKNLYLLRDSLKQHNVKLNSAKAKLKYELSDEVKKAKFIIEAQDVFLSYKSSNSYKSSSSDKPDNLDAKPIISDFSIQIKKGEKIGIIGPNGSGKTSLIKLLTKSIDPDSGAVKHGTNLEITYFDQHRSDLKPEYSLKKTLCPTGGDQVFLKDKSMHVAGYLKNFMFDPKRLNDKVETLSGGEAGRLLLAKSLINPGNLLILDEPTNDLDMDSLEILQEILAEYTGTLLIVSHDRDFLERLVTRSLVFTEDNKIIDLYGGYEDYLKYYTPANTTNDKPKLENKSKKHKISAKDQEGDGEGAEIVTDGPDSVKSIKPAVKLSYKYARLLEVLPIQIEELEEKIKILEKNLSDPDLYIRDPEKFMKLTLELEESKIDLNAKLEEWVRIDSL